jgi:predicted GIY-YIG superfamily endonuclease
MLRDRLLARMSGMGGRIDYQRLADEVLGIRNAPPELAHRLVTQALVVEERRDAWKQAGERICAAAPELPGVYVLRDEADRALYVGKAINLRRRLRAHFAPRRWRALRPEFGRAAGAEWQEVGSELEALVREAALIHELQPLANIQVAAPAVETRAIPAAILRDVIVVVRSVESDSAELVCARTDGGWMIQRTRRSGADLRVHTARLTRFFSSPMRRAFQGPQLAPIVYSWLVGRGAESSRIHPEDAASPRELRARLQALLADQELFAGRIVVINSKIPVRP